MSTPQQWAENNARVIVHVDGVDEPEHGTVVEFYEPSAGAVGVQLDGFSGIVRVPAEQVELEPTSEAMEAILSVSGVGDVRAQEILSALRGAGFEITPRNTSAGRPAATPGVNP